MSIPLKTKSGFINPFWLNKVRSGIHLSIINADGSLTLCGETLLFSDPECILPSGTQVRVWLTKSFECESLETYQLRKAQREDIEKQLKEKDRRKANVRRQEALAINRCISLPVGWEPAIKDVLSGLSATSWGDGRNRSTVQHIRLKEDMQAGKLKRKKGDFLCTASSGSNGKSYCNSHKEEWSDGEGLPYEAPVTCKACLQIAERLKDKS